MGKNVMMAVMNLGTHSATRDAGQIDFRAVHVVTQVAPHAPCRPLLVNGFLACTGGHVPVRAEPAPPRPSGAQKPVRKDSCAGRWNP